MKTLLSKEILVMWKWGAETWKWAFIKWVDKDQITTVRDWKAESFNAWLSEEQNE